MCSCIGIFTRYPGASRNGLFDFVFRRLGRRLVQLLCSLFFFFNDTATTEIYTLSLHDALPISIATGNTFILKPSEQVPFAPTRIIELAHEAGIPPGVLNLVHGAKDVDLGGRRIIRSEEHTSELQSHSDLVCRLLLEKKKTITPVQFVSNKSSAASTSYSSTKTKHTPPMCFL